MLLTVWRSRIDMYLFGMWRRKEAASDHLEGTHWLQRYVTLLSYLLAFDSSPNFFTADHSQGISRRLQSLVYKTLVYKTSHILPTKPSSTIYASSCTDHLQTIVYLPPVDHLGYHVAHALVYNPGNSVYHVANLQKPTTLSPTYNPGPTREWRGCRPCN